MCALRTSESTPRRQTTKRSTGTELVSADAPLTSTLSSLTSLAPRFRFAVAVRTCSASPGSRPLSWTRGMLSAPLRLQIPNCVCEGHEAIHKHGHFTGGKDEEIQCVTLPHYARRATRLVSRCSASPPPLYPRTWTRRWGKGQRESLHDRPACTRLRKHPADS